LEESKKIVEDILAEAERRAGEIIGSAKREADSIVQAAQISGREEKENLLSVAKVKAQQRFKEKMMAAKLESKRHFLLKREELLQRVFDEVRKRLEEFAESGDYASWMEKELEAAVAELDTRELEVEVRKEDLKLLEKLRQSFKKKGVEIKIGSPIVCLGGFRAKTLDGKMAIDLTFERKLERLGDEAKTRIARVLFE